MLLIHPDAEKDVRALCEAAHWDTDEYEVPELEWHNMDFQGKEEMQAKLFITLRMGEILEPMFLGWAWDNKEAGIDDLLHRVGYILAGMAVHNEDKPLARAVEGVVRWCNCGGTKASEALTAYLTEHLKDSIEFRLRDLNDYEEYFTTCEFKRGPVLKEERP